MPANVTGEFERAKAQYEQATSSQAKLAALAEMQRAAPSHKGAEKLKADISKKIARAKKEIEKQKEQEKKKGSAPSLSVKKEGIGQIAIVGLPNSGKSTLLKALTEINVEIAPYPFTTKKPQIGMMPYRDAKIQLVEMPAVIKGSAKGQAQGTQILSVIRTADAVVLLAKGREEEEALKKEMALAKIILDEKKPRIEIKQSKFKGITISGKKFLKCKEGELVEFLKNMGMFNVEVILSEPTTIAKAIQAMDNSIVYIPCLKINPFEEKDLEGLKKKIFELLGKILIYTKKPGKKADYTDPLAIKKGTTIDNVARLVHKDLAKKLKVARVWGSTKFPGQRVPKNFVPKDGDLVEIYV